MSRHLKQLLMGTISLLLLSAAMLAQATEKGLFWQMESPNGYKSYLFGTIHTDDNRVTDFSPRVLDAIKRTDLFVMETKPNSHPSNFLMAEGSLKNVLTQAEIKKVRKLTDFHVMHVEQALRMKPWLLAVVFSQSKPQTPYAQDNLLMRGAEDAGKPVEGLETSQEHFGIMDGFSLDEQLVILRTALNMTEVQKERNFERLIAVYLKEDSDALMTLDADMTAAELPEALAQRLRIKLLDERNMLMAERAIHLAQHQSVFIAVGAAHLAGDSGLINAFKKAGFKLTRLNK